MHITPPPGGMLRSIRFWLSCAMLYGLTGMGFSAAALPLGTQQQTIAGYRSHLQSLVGVVAGCRQHIDAAHCSSDAVGPDDVVSGDRKTQQRVSYEWLRRVLSSATETNAKPAETAVLLEDAEQRLAEELSEAPGGAQPAPASYSTQAAHAALTKILDRPEFRTPDPSLTERIMDAASLWINRRLTALAEYSSHRRWLGLLLEWGLAALACIGLAYWFYRQARRARGVHPEQAEDAGSASGLRNWEHLRRLAEQAASQQRWREAVRDYYWAAIARLESRGLWPADRTRTPREYLRLLPPGNARRDDLRLLTRRLETCWYGSDTAAASDCDAARQLFERLAAR